MRQKGHAALLLVFILGMITVLVGLSLVRTGFVESVMARTTASSTRAFYVANSGVEDALYKIQRIENYGVASPEVFELEIGGGRATVTVWGSKDQRSIESLGLYKDYLRRLRVEVFNTSLKPGFGDAIHAGQGGFELRHNTLITAKDDASGNVYSNSFVKGAKSDFSLTSNECKTSASKIGGSVWAVERITKLGENDTGVCVEEDAYSENLEYCFVKGDLYSPNSPAASCQALGSFINEPAPEEKPLPDMGVDNLKNYLTSKGKVFAGDCILDGSGGVQDCSGGTNTIGELIITGNLRKPSNVNVKIAGPVWVKGKIIFDSLGSVKLSPEITEVSQIVVSDGSITVDSNVAFGGNADAFLLFISTYLGTTPEMCDDPSISLSSNTNSVLFYATVGCVFVRQNSEFHGAILGERILVDANSTVEYDPALQSAIFGLTKSGGWQITKFEEY